MTRSKLVRADFQPPANSEVFQSSTFEYGRKADLVRFPRRPQESAMKYIPRTWNDPIEEWQDWLVVAGRRKGTIALRGYQMRRLGRAFPHTAPWDVTNDELIRWIAQQGWDVDTLRGHRAAFRSFYSWALATGRTTINPAAALPSVPAKAANPNPTPEEVVSTTLETAGDRERLMVMCAAFAGMRSCEIARIHWRDFFRDFEGWSVTAHGKGGKTRMLPLADDLAKELITRCRENNGWLFPGRMEGHLSPAYVSKLLSQTLGPHWTGHTLRHRYSAVTFEKSRDVRAVQELLGHASLATTQRYIPVPGKNLRRAALSAAAVVPERMGNHTASGVLRAPQLAAAA